MSAPAIRHPGEVRWETRLLAVVTAVLIAFGMAAVASATLTVKGEIGAVGLDRLTRQVVGVVGGTAAMIWLSQVDYRRYRAWAWPLLGVIVLMLLVVKFGPAAISPTVNGARRWLRVPGIGFASVQPSELARIVVVIWAAMLATKKGDLMRDFKRGTLPFLVVIGAVFFLIERQPNLSMAILVAGAGGIVMFCAGAKIGHFFVSVLAALPVVLAIASLEEYRWRRILNFLCKSNLYCADGAKVAEQSLGVGYQQNIAVNGIASGGATGVGYGKGVLKLGHLPEAGTDFLFATIGEEWGFTGVAFVVVLYAAFIWLGFRIARTASDPFGTFVAAGLTFGIGFSALAHIGVDIGLLPVTGLTLPFMSSGLSSMLTNCAAVGILLSIGQARGRLAPRAGA